MHQELRKQEKDFFAMIYLQIWWEKSTGEKDYVILSVRGCVVNL